MSKFPSLTNFDFFPMLMKLLKYQKKICAILQIKAIKLQLGLIKCAQL